MKIVSALYADQKNQNFIMDNFLNGIDDFLITSCILFLSF